MMLEERQRKVAGQSLILQRFIYPPCVRGEKESNQFVFKP
jgi:hypothetical protein